MINFVSMNKKDTTQINKNTFKIPSYIIKTGKFLQFFSSKWATKYVLKLFATPPNYKTPDREKMMRESAKKVKVAIPTLQKEVMVYEYGYSKQKVLLTHGWAGRGTQLYEIADNILENRMMVISFDAPAHGLSDGKQTNLLEYIEAIKHLSKIYGPFEAVVGHSFGGIALLATIAEQTITDKLVVIGIENSIPKIVDLFVEKLELKQKVAGLIKKEMERLFSTNLVAISPMETAKKVKIPTLVLHDTEDYDVAVSSAYKIRQNLEQGEILITNGLGHRRILRDKKVIQRIIDFITE